MTSLTESATISQRETARRSPVPRSIRSVSEANARPFSSTAVVSRSPKMKEPDLGTRREDRPDARGPEKLGRGDREDQVDAAADDVVDGERDDLPARDRAEESGPSIDSLCFGGQRAAILFDGRRFQKSKNERARRWPGSFHAIGFELSVPPRLRAPRVDVDERTVG